MDGNKSFATAVVRCSLQDNEPLKALAKAIVQKLGYKVMGDADCSYPNSGFSYIIFLAESHLILETYPENSKLEISLVTCRPLTQDVFLGVLGRAGVSRGMIESWQVVQL